MSSLYLTPADATILKGVSFYCYYADRFLAIQFPPKVTSDSRKMNWSEHKSGWGVDPTAHFAGNSGREMTIKFEYVVETDAGGFGPLWTILKVKDNINLLKGIFTGFKNQQEDGDNDIGLVGENGQVLIKFKYPMITGALEAKTFRVSTVSVEYSDEIVIANTNDFVQNGTSPICHPLKSVVTVGMTTYSLGVLQEANTDWELASLFPTYSELWY